MSDSFIADLSKRTKDGKFEGNRRISFADHLKQSLLTEEERQWVNHSGHDGNSDNDSTESLSDEELLCLYASQGAIERMRELIQNGVPADSFNNDGDSALHCACSSGSDASVGMLLSKGAQVNQKGRRGLTPLHLACIHNSAACCSTLLRHGADSRAISEDGRIPLHFAAESGAEECVRQLLMQPPNVRGDVNATDNDGRTPLHFAVIGGSEGVVRRILQAGADVMVKDSQGRGAVDIGETMGHPPGIMQMLLAHASEAIVQSANGVTEQPQQRLHASLSSTKITSNQSHGGRYVLVDADGCLVEDMTTHRVVVYHMKVNALHYASEAEGSMEGSSWKIAQIETSKWEEFRRHVQFEWKDEDEEDDPMLAQYLREQHSATITQRQQENDREDTDELSSQISDMTKEIENLKAACANAEQQLHRINAEIAELEPQVNAPPGDMDIFKNLTVVVESETHTL